MKGMKVRRNFHGSVPIIMGLCFISVFSSRALCLGSFPWGEEIQVTEEGFVRWIKERAVHFDTLDGKHNDLAALSILDKEIEGKRVVYLGEPDHFIHEKYDFQLMLVRYLFERGFRYVGYEAGIFTSRLIDAYLETGDPAYLDPTGLLDGNKYAREDRDDTPSGYPALHNPEYVMKELNNKNNIRYLEGEALWKALNEAKEMVAGIKFWELDTK